MHREYRELATRSASEVPSTELVYTAIDREQQTRAGFATLQLIAVPFIVFGLVAHFVSIFLGVLAAVGCGALGHAWWRRARMAGAILRVESGDLQVRSRLSKKDLLRARLAEVTDVTLEKKTIQRVQEGGSAIPAVRFVETRVGPELEKARIVVVVGPRRVPLSEEYLADIEATEWLGKIRVFLRKHGWVPADEAPANEEDDEE